MATIMSKLEILDELKDLQLSTHEGAPKLEIDFPKYDENLIVELDAGTNTLVGELRIHGKVEETTNVICDLLKEELMRFGEQGPRHISIYSKISANTLVHPFYGVAEKFGKRWTVMKDLRKASTLATAIEQKLLPTSIADRIDIAQKIATTVGYLHSVEILLKYLSDTTILLVANPEGYTPYLTDLDRARMVCLH
jgi:hypothetical protein